MKHKTKISLFPQSRETDIICEHKDAMCNFDVSAVVSYRGESPEKKNIYQDILQTDDIEQALLNSSGLVLCDNVNNFGKRAYLNRLQDTANLNKIVYTSSYIYDWLGEEAFSRNEVVILNENAEKRTYAKTSLYEINCPVISILGLGENCDKLAILLSLRKKFSGRRV
jgi:hypothetical protein